MWSVPRALAVLLLALQACAASSLRADLPAPPDRCRRSAVEALKRQDGSASRVSDGTVEGALKDGTPVRILLDPLADSGTRVRVTVGRGETPDEIAQAVRILEQMADGMDR